MGSEFRKIGFGLGVRESLRGHWRVYLQGAVGPMSYQNTSCCLASHGNYRSPSSIWWVFECYVFAIHYNAHAFPKKLFWRLSINSRWGLGRLAVERRTLNIEQYWTLCEFLKNSLWPLLSSCRTSWFDPLSLVTVFHRPQMWIVQI